MADFDHEDVLKQKHANYPIATGRWFTWNFRVFPPGEGEEQPRGRVLAWIAQAEWWYCVDPKELTEGDIWLPLPGRPVPATAASTFQHGLTAMERSLGDLPGSETELAPKRCVSCRAELKPAYVVLCKECTEDGTDAEALTSEPSRMVIPPKPPDLEKRCSDCGIEVPQHRSLCLDCDDEDERA